VSDWASTTAEENARLNLRHLDELTLAVCYLRDGTYSKRRFLDEAEWIADEYSPSRVAERRRRVEDARRELRRDRPRLVSPKYARLNPRRLVVIRDTDAEGWPEWMIYRGAQDLSTHPTHAEAITAAQRIARERVYTAWTTPDSGTRADYGLMVG